MFSTYDKEEERLVALPGSSSRNGEVSESDENWVNVGGNGDPSVFFAKKPALKRLFLDFVSTDGTGGAGIGDESGESEPSLI